MAKVALAGLLALAGPGGAQVDGVVFRASYDGWLAADRAPGGMAPLRRVGGSLAPGKLGQALALDGQSYLEYRAGRNVPVAAGTVCFWFRPASWGARRYDSLFGFSDSNRNAFDFERSHPDGRLRLVIGGPDSTDGAKTRSLYSLRPLVDGQWVHVAASWDAGAGTATLYLDGVPQAGADKDLLFPKDPPSILVGCGFGRLARAVTGLIDELVVLDHAATTDELKAVMAGAAGGGAMTAWSNDSWRLAVDGEAGTITIGALDAAGGDPLIGPARPEAVVDGNRVVWTGFDAGAAEPPIAPRLGPGEHRVFTSRERAAGVTLRYHLQTQREQPTALLWMELVNDSDRDVRVGDLGLLSAEGDDLGVSRSPDRLAVFLDTGWLTRSGTHLLPAPSARWESHGATVLAERDGGWAASMSFVTFRAGWPTTRLECDRDGRPTVLSASCAYPNGRRLPPGRRLESEVLALSLHGDGFTALSNWADTVMAVGELSPPRHCPNGWNSWYCYRLEITEDLVLANAKVIGERFGAYGLTNIQIDHGWQHRDLVGEWTANDRFPHGLPWLADKLAERGQSLGLWTAVSHVSEFAPFAIEHPDLLVHEADGQLKVATQHWTWAPHGKTYTLDPTQPLGEAKYRADGAKLREYRCTYNKNDFQSNLTAASGVVADRDTCLGVPLWHRAMAAFAAGRGEDMAYHACGAPLNLVAGQCDVAWVHRDIGNPAGNWEHLRGYANDFATRHHVAGKFYYCDPDYLQVGQGDLNETRVRMAFMALGGGPAFLSDRLPELPPEKLDLIAQCLPSYGRCMRPMDLFEREGYPRVWDLPVATKWGRWHVVGLFNLDEAPARIELDLGQLNLRPGSRCLVYDYFAGRLLGEVAVPVADDLSALLRFDLPPTSVRVLKVVEAAEQPFVLSTDLHLTQGGVELPEVRWDPDKLTLSGTATRAPGTTGHLVVWVPAGYRPLTGSAADGLLRVPLSFGTDQLAWSIGFAREG